MTNLEMVGVWFIIALACVLIAAVLYVLFPE